MRLLEINLDNQFVELRYDPSNILRNLLYRAETSASSE